MTATKQNVLVIDDDPVALGMISGVLERAGFLVHTMSSPIGATRAIRDHAVGAVVCDLHMPAMRGDAFARLFRQSPMLRNIPLIVISGAPRQELDDLTTDGMVDGVVHKSDLQLSLVPMIRRLGKKPR